MIEKQLYSACTSILIGKKASIDGSIMIGRNEDSKAAWPKNYIIHPGKTHETPQIFKSNANKFELSLPKVAYKYSATPEWTLDEGYFEEDGINEFNVAMSATESAYTNDNVLSVDPLVADGIGEEAMINVILPYVKTAREGILRLGQIIERYGTCETNGILFADLEEVWYMETAGGHQWVAQRIPDDSYAVVSNQLAIQEIDFNDHENFMWAPSIVEFVTKNNLNPALDGSFNFRNIFGTDSLQDQYYNYPRVWYGLKMFSPELEFTPTSNNMPFINKASRKLSVNDAQAYLASHYQGTQYDPVGAGSPADKKRFRPVSLAKTQEAHVLQLRPNMPKEAAGIQWLAMGVAAESTFVPFYAGATQTPDSYHQARPKFNPENAYWVYKHASVLVDAHYGLFEPKLQDVQAELRQKFGQVISETDQKAVYHSGIELKTLLTKVNFQNAELGLTRYRQLASDLITLATDLSPLNYKHDTNL
ncbi:C69 family dipeptidase [Lentilactobacillus senioris]|uniref:C69 family dipeptidase n=1 Tax=Lentilactobacillus senioris TaxID=931534 RepID=UPI00227EF3E6|nr:C69 family dipeptidase [Lentilactobacillus senioris]MCY9806834.1 C69 family dipeptidase [Lentilactobacillus senioris]